MQQQSQIFVFSTALANKAAEAVLRGEYSSIIAYHCAQPGTKKYLEVLWARLNYFTNIVDSLLHTSSLFEESNL